MNNIDKYVEATGKHLGVENQRYGSGFIAIVASRSASVFLFDKLDSGDSEGTEAQSFFAENAKEGQREALERLAI